MGRRCLAVALLVGAGCAGASPQPQLPASPPASDNTLGPGDTFEVAVYNEKELSGRYQIADDGSINFPLVGQISVGGKMPMEIATAIQDALRDKQILRNPSVSIFVLEYASRRVSVVGAVQKPGTFAWISGMTVVQAISLAGGLTPLADANDTIVTRLKDGAPTRYKVAVTRVTEGRDRDFQLQNGDVIYVPQRVF